ncbi:MAG: hypothetical protein ACTHLZ_17010 [Tepidisphaeraceae bacterium]
MNKRIAGGALLSFCIVTAASSGRANELLAKSQWVQSAPDGSLIYKKTPEGDRIMDFSFAGYGGGGVALPVPDVVITVHPANGGDDAIAIQKAIDDVSARRLVNGFRGAVLLGPGEYQCSSTLVIKASGVVLRGSGAGHNGSVLNLQGRPHVAVSIEGPPIPPGPAKAAPSARVTDPYVPSGASSLTVDDAKHFAPHDVVQIVKPVTAEWVKFMRMDALERNGKPETWVEGELYVERTVVAVEGSRLTFDIPLSDSLNAKFCGPAGARVVKIAAPRRLSGVGIENMRIVSPPQHVEITEPLYEAIQMDGVADAWARDLQLENTVNSVVVKRDVRRVTFERVTVNNTTTTKGAAKPADFWCQGSQILFDRCEGSGNKLFFIATGSRLSGPNVALNCTFKGDGQIQPHQRWATGFLVDNCHVPNGSVDFMNRGIMGSGHGWTIGWAVAWNCTAASFLIQQPPGAYNWAIGCKGEQRTAAMPGIEHHGAPAPSGDILPQGVIDSPGKPVSPKSLYLTQLRARLGPDAVKNIGY